MSPSFEQMLESKENLEKINSTQAGEEATKLHPRRQKYEEKNRRVTLYLSNETYADLQAVRSQGYSQSALVDSAVKEYIARYWPTSQP